MRVLVKHAARVGFVFLFSSSAFAQVYVGNGGEGIDLGSQVYSRDLFEAKIHDSAWIGNEFADFTLNRTELKILGDLGISQDLFLRKLQDLKEWSGGLPIAMRLGLIYFQWTLSDETLPRLNDDSPVPRDFDGHRLQLAIRNSKTVLIARQPWGRMDEINRLALVVHEILYAFQVPECDSRDICAQSPMMSRSWTAQVFSPVGRRDASRTNQEFAQFFGISANGTRLTVNSYPSAQGVQDSLRLIVDEGDLESRLH